MTDHLDNDKNLKCGHKAIDWDGNGNCITCARDKILGVGNDKDKTVWQILIDIPMKVNLQSSADGQLRVIREAEKAIDQYTQSKLKAFAEEVDTLINRDETEPSSVIDTNSQNAVSDALFLGDRTGRNKLRSELRESLKAIKVKYQL